MASPALRWNEALELARSGDALLIDIREAYQRSGRPPSEVRHLPLGILLGSPELVPITAPVVLFGGDQRSAEFAARYLRDLGYLASTTAVPETSE